MTDDQHTRFIQMFLELSQNYIACGGTVVIGMEQNLNVRPITITGGDVTIMRNILPLLSVEIVDRAAYASIDQRLLHNN